MLRSMELRNPMCKLFRLRNKPLQLKWRSLIVQIEQDSQRVHEDHPQQPVALMPQITRPDALGLAPLDQLPKDGINPIAYSAQHGTPTMGRGMLGAAKGCQQADASPAQKGFERGQPVIAVSQEQSARACGQIGDDLAFMDVGRGQDHLGNYSRPAQADMQAEAIEGLASRMVLAVVGLPSEAPTAGGAGELTDRDRKTINDGNRWVIGQELVSYPFPEAFFDGPQIGRLAHKAGAVQMGQSGKEGRPVVTKVREQRFILAQSQIGPNHFHRENLAIREFGQWAALTQPRTSRDARQQIINQTKPCDNQLVQAHSHSPQQVIGRSEDEDAMRLVF